MSVTPKNEEDGDKVFMEPESNNLIIDKGVINQIRVFLKNCISYEKLARKERDANGSTTKYHNYRVKSRVWRQAAISLAEEFGLKIT